MTAPAPPPVPLPPIPAPIAPHERDALNTRRRLAPLRRRY